MAYYNDGKVFRNLPEQVEKNKSDIESIQDAQKTDESNINTNLNNINAHETRINALESLKMTQDGQNIKLTKSTGEIGNIAVGTVGGTNLLGGNDVTFKTINGEAITGEGDLSVDTGLSSLLWANLGIGKWADQELVDFLQSDDTYFDISDNLAPYYTNVSRYMNGAIINTKKIIRQLNAFNLTEENISTNNIQNVFSNITTSNNNELQVKGGYLPWTNCFVGSNFSKISVAEGETCYFYTAKYYTSAFNNLPNLTEIGEFDMSKMPNSPTMYWFLFGTTTNVKLIHCKHFKYSFNISRSTAFEETGLVEILNNLDSVSTTQTLIMGSTNLAKLTTDDILIATGKGWQLA